MRMSRQIATLSVIGKRTYYSYGDECTTKTGGWVKEQSPNGGTCAKYANRLYIFAPAEDQARWRGGHFTTAQMVDLTAVKTLRIYYQGFGAVQVLNAAKSVVASVGGIADPSTLRWRSIDVSRLTGSYYIRLSATTFMYEYNISIEAWEVIGE